MSNKYKIESVSRLFGGRYWKVTPPDTLCSSCYSNYAAAAEYVRKSLLRTRKVASAYSMVLSLSVNLLSHAEWRLISKLLKTKCHGITVRQYGYLKGIHERQVRSW